MPLLKQDKNGNIYEVDSRFDDERGVGRKPNLVEDDNVAKISLPQVQQEVVERMQARFMSEAGQKNFQQQQKLNQAKFELGQKLKEIAKYYQAKANHLKAQKIQSANDKIKINAISQGARSFEDIGVSGDGLSPVGAKTWPTFPATDYHKIMPVSYDFGKLNQSMGAETTALSVNPYEMMKATASPIKGNYTTYHQFLIQMWEQNKYAVTYHNMDLVKNPDGTYMYDKDISRYVTKNPDDPVFREALMDLANKKKMWDIAESQYWAGKYPLRSELVKSSKRGWMWSGWHDESGNWIQVKVPFVYGLPIDAPEVVDTPENLTRQRAYRTENFLSYGYSFKIFDSLKEVIEAYALYYKYILGEISFEQPKTSILAQPSEFVAQTSNKETQSSEQTQAEATQAENGDKAIVKEAIEKAAGSMDFRHPMAQKGLL